MVGYQILGAALGYAAAMVTIVVVTYLFDKFKK